MIEYKLGYKSAYRWFFGSKSSGQSIAFNIKNNSNSNTTLKFGQFTTLSTALHIFGFPNHVHIIFGSPLFVILHRRPKPVPNRKKRRLDCWLWAEVFFHPTIRLPLERKRPHYRFRSSTATFTPTHGRPNHHRRSGGRAADRLRISTIAPAPAPALAPALAPAPAPASAFALAFASLASAAAAEVVTC